jgi:hypothetical protein
MYLLSTIKGEKKRARKINQKKKEKGKEEEK